ncbi:MAG: hypothetical protein JWR55_2577 [Aeromicrobium sp.]|jgi:hypothetical protein|nr:hypothetical protein [Aeromicrobium sp.]
MTAEVDWHARLVGTELPPGTLRVEPYEDRLARDALGGDRAEGDLLHPSWILNGALRGAGHDVAGLIELFGASWDDGVLFGEARIEQVEPLRASVDYAITGTVLDVERRNGRRVRCFDVVTYEMRVERDDRVFARVRNRIVIPRQVAE